MDLKEIDVLRVILGSLVLAFILDPLIKSLPLGIQFLIIIVFASMLGQLYRKYFMEK